MDRVPPKLPNTSSRLIAMAVSLVGDSKLVIDCMHCSEADFLEYQAGSKEPGWPQLDRLIQLIVREQSIMIAKNRELIARIRERHD